MRNISFPFSKTSKPPGGRGTVFGLVLAGEDCIAFAGASGSFPAALTSELGLGLEVIAAPAFPAVATRLPDDAGAAGRTCTTAFRAPRCLPRRSPSITATNQNRGSKRPGDKIESAPRRIFLRDQPRTLTLRHEISGISGTIPWISGSGRGSFSGCQWRSRALQTTQNTERQRIQRKLVPLAKSAGQGRK